MVKTARLPHGTLRLAVYANRAMVTIIPADPDRLPVVREYDWAHKAKAISDYETIKETACVRSTTARAS